VIGWFSTAAIGAFKKSFLKKLQKSRLLGEQPTGTTRIEMHQSSIIISLGVYNSKPAR